MEVAMTTSPAFEDDAAGASEVERELQLRHLRLEGERRLVEARVVRALERLGVEDAASLVEQERIDDLGAADVRRPVQE